MHRRTVDDQTRPVHLGGSGPRSLIRPLARPADLVQLPTTSTQLAVQTSPK